MTYCLQEYFNMTTGILLGLIFFATAFEHVRGGFSCNFEKGMCDYTQDQGDDFDWTRFQGRTETRETGPDVDHTHGTRLGYYLYAEASGRSEGNRARLTSLSEEVVKPQCIHFFYSMYGDTTGSLRVYVKDITSASLGDPVWSLSDNRGGGWYRGLASVQNSTNRIQLVFEAEIGNGEYSDIAIDDVEVKEGLCPLDFLNCTFEEEVGMCGFVHDETADFDFIHWNGKTYSSNPGPAIDHTTGTEEGYFMYTEALWMTRNKVARLISPTFRGIQGDDKETFCVVFWYHMYKANIGELTVYLRTNSSSVGSPIWSLAGGRGDVWRGAEAEINTHKDFNIVFEGARGSSYNGHIAIDDILITSFACPGHHIIKNESSVTCDFEEIELCYYVQDDTDTIDWKWQNQATKDGYNGPEMDHTRGDEFGFYLFVGSSIYHDTEDVARIMSPIATASPSISSCVEFWYHMWGRDVETLNVYIKPESMALPSTPVTKLTGDQGNYWHRRTFTVPAGSGEYRVVFEGIPGVYIRDDIAIDDVRLFVEQSCPEFVTEPPQPTTMPPGRDNIDCDFEEDFCDYMQELDADYGDWERRQGLDGRDWPAFSRTGPTKDHTLDTRYGYYASFDPYDLKGAVVGDLAVLKSPFISPKPHERCLVLYAYMFGYGIDYFTIQIVEWGGTQTMDPSFAIFGNYGERWMELEIDVPSSTLSFQILFVGSVGNSKSTSEIGLDDITLKNGKCQAKATKPPVPWAANCDFESTSDPFCGYTNYGLNEYDWVVHSGSTSSSNTGPPGDHTTGNATGHYAYVETSIPHRPKERTIMRSPILNSRNQDICIRFYYHAHGKDVGSLSVVGDLEDSYDAITPFSISGDQGNIWNPANVYLPASFTFIHNFRIEFSTEKLMDGFEGDVAIDDILFLQQPCDGYPSESECTFEEGLFGCGYSDDATAEYQWEWFDILAVEEPPLNTISTSYMYAKALIPSPGQTAEFYSAIYDLNGRTHCLTFDVVLTSDNTQQLLIQAQEMETETRHDIGSLTGDIDGSWFTLGWPIQGDLLNSPFQLVFKAVYGSSTDGVIALDNVFFSEHLDVCKENAAPPTKVPIKSTSLSTDTTISRHPKTRSKPKVSMIVGVTMAVVIAVAVIIGVLMFLKYRSSTGSLIVGNKNERLDAKPFSMDSSDTGRELNSNPQMVNRGTDQGLQA